MKKMTFSGCVPLVPPRKVKTIITMDPAVKNRARLPIIAPGSRVSGSAPINWPFGGITGQSHRARLDVCQDIEDESINRPRYLQQENKSSSVSAIAEAVPRRQIESHKSYGG